MHHPVPAVLAFLFVEALVVATGNPWAVARRIESAFQHPRDWTDPQPSPDGGREAMNAAWFTSSILIAAGTALAFGVARNVY